MSPKTFDHVTLPVCYWHPGPKWSVTIYDCLSEKWRGLKFLWLNREPGCIFFQPAMRAKVQIFSYSNIIKHLFIVLKCEESLIRLKGETHTHTHTQRDINIQSNDVLFLICEWCHYDVLLHKDIPLTFNKVKQWHPCFLQYFLRISWISTLCTL